MPPADQPAKQLIHGSRHCCSRLLRARSPVTLKLTLCVCRMDTNIVRPTGQETCEVVFDWWVDESLSRDTAFIEESLASSHQARPCKWR